MLQREKCEEECCSVIKRVERLFINEPMTANSDLFLWVRYLQVYHNISSLNEILRKGIPKPATIERCSRKLRSQKDYGVVESVEENRRENEVAFANVFGGR